jgi:hypothetical protein
MKIHLNEKWQLVLAIIFMFGVVSVANAQSGLDEAVTDYLAKDAAKEQADEYDGARKILKGDVDGDGTEDAVVLYTLEGMGGGGNNWGQSLVVIRNVKGKYLPSNSVTVGGKFFQSFSLVRLASRKIYGSTETCPKDSAQGMCKNPRKGVSNFAIRGGKLVKG